MARHLALHLLVMLALVHATACTLSNQGAGDSGTGGSGNGAAGDGDGDTGDGDGDTGDGDTGDGDGDGDAGDGDGDGDGDQTPGCAQDVDCDDQLPCTRDSCDEGDCSNAVAPGSCAAGSQCAPDGTCAQAAACGSDEDCADDDPCTRSEVCDLRVATCTWALLDGDGDGFVPLACGGDDPDDTAASYYPGSPETCDGFDNDEDGEVDEVAAAQADCDSRGSGTCTMGYCNRCTDEDILWLRGADGMGDAWIRRAGICHDAQDPETCYTNGLLDSELSESCYACFQAHFDSIKGCGGLGCYCQEGPALDELRVCANGIQWSC